MGIAAAGTFAIAGDRTVHRLGFGAMRLCGPMVWGYPEDRDNAGIVLRRALELGVDFIDTADAYGPEVNEYQIRDALAPYPAGLLVATKGGLHRGPPEAWPTDGRPVHLRRAILNSKRRLGLDVIDLYQLHAPCDAVPFEDSVRALAEARAEGHIRHVGLSNVTVDQLEAARAIVPIATVQNRYNLEWTADDDVVAACERHDIGFIPWYPLAAAELSRHDRGVLAEIAAAHSATPSQVALAWLLAKSPVMLPIPGTSKVAHLEENVAAADLVLSASDMAALDGMGR